MTTYLTVYRSTKPTRRPAPVPCTCHRIGFCAAHGTYEPHEPDIQIPQRRPCYGRVVRKKIEQD